MKYWVYLLRFALLRVIAYPMLVIFCLAAIDFLFTEGEDRLLKLVLVIGLPIYLYKILQLEKTNFEKFFALLHRQFPSKNNDDILDS